VHDEAERLWNTKPSWPVLPESDPDSIVVEVLMHLDALDHQLVLREDVPAILTFLATAQGAERFG
jgi:hypothetical protein